MANTAQARKRARQAVARRLRNIAQKTKFRTFQKRALAALASKDVDKATTAFKKFVQVADAVAGRGVVHANKAARIKSRLNTALKSLSNKA